MKISIVTPSNNSERFIAETIESVISQKGDFEVEYFIIDNCSNDRTLEIIKKYEGLLEQGLYPIKCPKVSMKWLSEKDKGMYDAINKGFALATGDVFAWINADDFYLPGAFDIVAKVFQKYTEIKWLKGITSYINESSIIYQTGKCFLYNQQWIEKGVYGREAYFIQQDSVFWRSELWKRSGGIDCNLRLAGDYYLWNHFAKETPLFTVKAYFSCFRRVEGQLSQRSDEYRKECLKICKYRDFKIRIFFVCERFMPIPARSFLYRILFASQRFNLVELIDGKEPVLKNVSYYFC